MQFASELKTYFNDPRIQMDPTVALRLKQRLLAEVVSYQPRPAAVVVIRGFRLAVSSIVAIILLVGGIGTVAASNQSLPGSPLYGLKIGIERTMLAFAWSTEREAELHLRFADRRLAELGDLAAYDKISRLPSSVVQVAVRSLKSEVEAAKNSLEVAIAAGDANNHLLKLAEKLNSQALATSTVLAQLRKSPTAAPAVAVAVSETIQASLNSSSKALGIIASAGTDKQSLKDQLTARIANQKEQVESIKLRIAALSNQVNGQLSTAKSVSKQADAVLNEAERLIAKDDLSGALAKVIEVQDLAVVSEQQVSKAESATPVVPILQVDGTSDQSKNEVKNPVDQPVAPAPQE
ncbi:MAG: DUF5667 domain-containing protein [bacterium]